MAMDITAARQFCLHSAMNWEWIRLRAFKIGEGFGLGMGGMENTCGALSGAIMLAGLKNSDGDLDHPKTKAGTYRISRELTEAFKEKTGALVCRDLKGIDTGKVLCSCPKCIDSAVQIVEEILGL